MDPLEIARVRRFARAVTVEVGALDTSFLGRGRPLGVARVLNAIGAGRTEVGEIRAYLGLDSGLMSRLLRGLEDEGLVATAPHPADARRRVASLTDAGRREFEAYEAMSDARAVALLGRASRAGDLLQAMDRIALALGREAIAIAEADPASEAARACLAAYYAELASRFAGGFDVALSCDPEAADMVRPRGVFLLAMADGLPAGCVGLKGSGGRVAEIKRLWTDPAARGSGLARRLMQAVERVARDLGVRTLRLDTNSALPEALNLYRTSGWIEIDRFNDDPYPDHFFEKAL
jgi:DNA-binding MarR family transcriptional regulator